MLLDRRGGTRQQIADALPDTAVVMLTVSRDPNDLFEALRAGASGEANPNSGKFRDLFVPRGYAVVIVDVRGTGASFGTRDSFRSPKEREDSREITDWVVAQPWSNGRVGATGVSMHVNMAMQVRGEAGDMQVKDAALGAVFNMGGVAVANYASVLEALR